MSYADTKRRRRERRLNRIAAAHEKRLIREGKNPWGPDVLCGRCGEYHGNTKPCSPVALQRAYEQMVKAKEALREREAVFAQRVRRRLGMTTEDE